MKIFLFVFLLITHVAPLSFAKEACDTKQDTAPNVAVGTPVSPNFWTDQKTDQTNSINEVFVKHKDRYGYFIDSILYSSAAIPEKLYWYVDPEIKGFDDPDSLFFEKILTLKYVDKSARERDAIDKINKFLATNYRNQTMPAQIYTGQAHLPDPFYLSELKVWTFGAVAKGDIDVLKAFLDNYNLLHIKNEEGYNLLTHAILHSQHDIAELLIRRGINVNEVNKYGVSALMIAARNNDLRAAQLLIDHKCKMNLKDKFGNNALSYASMNNNQDVHNYLSNISTKRAVKTK